MKTAGLCVFWIIIGVVAFVFGDRISAWTDRHAILILWIVGGFVFVYLADLIGRVDGKAVQAKRDIQDLASRIQKLERCAGLDSNDDL